MQITFSIDPEDEQIVAVYLRFSEGKVKKTIEVTDGACYVDVDSKGRAIGVELLNPDNLKAALRKVKKDFKLKGIDAAVKGLQHVLAA